MGTGELPPTPRLPSRTGAGKRRVRRSRALSRGLIVDAALRIVDNDGLDALTMRTVAHTLGTGAASLYAHVSGKEELLELVIEQVIGEIELGGAPDPARWQEQLKDGVRQIRAAFASHRDLARASFARIPVGENALRGAEWMIGVLRAGALPDQAVAYACDLLSLYAVVTAYEESLWAREEVTDEQAQAYFGEMRAYFAALPVERFAGVVSLAGPLTAGGEGDERFEFGLDVLVRGLATLAAGYH